MPEHLLLAVFASGILAVQTGKEDLVVKGQGHATGDQDSVLGSVTDLHHDLG